MGKIANLFKLDLASPIEAFGTALDKVTTTDEERMENANVMARLGLAKAELQVGLNKVEAQSKSQFNSGWRPAIGWVCALSLFLYFPVRFAVATVMWVALWISTGEVGPYPIGVEGLMQLVFGMLGLGAFRTYEKRIGRTR